MKLQSQLLIISIFAFLPNTSCTPIASNVQKTPIRPNSKQTDISNRENHPTNDETPNENEEVENTEIDGKVISQISKKDSEKSQIKNNLNPTNETKLVYRKQLTELFKDVDLVAEIIASKSWENKIKLVQSDFLKSNKPNKTQALSSDFFILTEAQIEGLQKFGKFIFQVEAEKLPKKIWLTLAVKPQNALSVKEIEKNVAWVLTPESMSIWQIEALKQLKNPPSPTPSPSLEGSTSEQAISARNSAILRENESLIFRNAHILSGFLKITYRAHSEKEGNDSQEKIQIEPEIKPSQEVPEKIIPNE